MIAAILLGAYALSVVIGLFVLWVLFVCAMAMKLAEPRLPPAMVRFCRQFVFVGTIYDVLCNMFLATGLFFDLPQEATVSRRLERLIVSPRWEWQRRLAIWFAVVAMNPFCKPDDPHINFPA